MSAQRTRKLEKLKTINAQLEKIRPAFNDARNRYDAAIDKANSAWVQQFEGICSYAMATGKGDAGCLYLLEECKAYDRAKRDYKLRRALHAQIVNVAGSGADALEGKKSSSSAPTVLTEFESLSDDEEASAYYRARRAEIHEAYNAQINNQNIK